jgi:hypothetical protein
MESVSAQGSRRNRLRRGLNILSSNLLQKVEALTDFVVGTGLSSHAFVENEALGDKTGKPGLAMDPGFQLMQSLCSSFALAARESDVGMVGTCLGDKPAKPCRSGDTLLQGEQFWREDDTRKENSGAIKEVQCLKLDRNGRAAQLAKPHDHAFVLRQARIPEKLQSDVP